MRHFLLQILDVPIAKFIVPEKVLDFIETAKNSVASFEWRFAEKGFKDTGLLMPVRSELCIGHRDLVQICGHGVEFFV